MNKARRKQVQELIDRLGRLQARVESDAWSSKNALDVSTAQEELKACSNEVESISEDEQEGYDNLPESLQESRCDSHDEIIGYLDNAKAALDEAAVHGAVEDGDDILQAVETACEELGNIN